MSLKQHLRLLSKDVGVADINDGHDAAPEELANGGAELDLEK